MPLEPPRISPSSLRQPEDDRQRLGVRDLVRVVDRRAFDVLRHPAEADALGDRAALGFQLAMLEPVIHRRAHRVGRGDSHLAVLFF
jgi:hypothetical protein